MFSLWRKARRENSAASRLLGTTSLRFALHGWQRLIFHHVPVRQWWNRKCRQFEPPNWRGSEQDAAISV
ncbi:hypothetical protein [Thiolapillus sp.]|uniref:hypothetical protein n=1 Tax=Thiolapillus sp. TaxID=2017437 RepID=UPI003AF7012A